ncbi:TRAP transporter substrate-binding protein DctP [Desulforhopalus singaporensis]|uniref:TRAP-type C4-dicarboxylate transport system, substrate-binding protein n=1 Tax=Desulforhopalus singaporensis TaxID=91360 RepID=A0A1H0SPA0_9BACT|nr:TRAP transporter substrate-binding protein DctP [Desulforhopalus singaporensis]SDP43581.1 TRAP-type C4-dicarboxylate transport system, substrate-binding protein [Desulforhopalus singaporensis]
MKKRILALMVSMLLFTSMVALADDSVFNLRMQSYYPQSMIGCAETFAKLAKTMSNGRLNITVFPDGTLTSPDNILKAVKAGMIDIGQGSGSYYSELEIGNTEIGLPMAWKNVSEARLLFEGLGFEKLVAQNYENQGVHYLGWAPVATYHILTKQPVNSLDDLRKMKIRAIGGAAKMLNKVGVATVNIKSSEMYLALSTGQVDGVLFGGALDYQAMKLSEVAGYYSATPIVDPIIDSFIVNPKLWNKLPEDMKTILETAALRAGLEYYDDILKEEYLLRSKAFKGVTSFPKEDITTLRKAAVVVWDEEAKRSTTVAEGIGLLKQLSSLVE